MNDNRALIGKRFRTDYLALGLGALSLIVLVWIIFINSYGIFIVEGISMQPGIESGDTLLIRSKREYTRGNIVVFFYEGDQKYFVKRVVATEGDALRFEVSGATVTSDTKVDLKLRKSGETEFSAVEEDYILEAMTKALLSWSAVQFNTEIVVPEGQFFALGDNRNISKDSRIIGFVDEDKIVGEVKFCAGKGSFAEGVLNVLYFASKEKKAENS